MAEYIEREAAFDAITDLAGKATTRSAYEAVWKSARALKKIPTADVVPVVHGKWIKRGYVCGDYEWECSVCHETEWRGLSGADVMRFCMFCGARMDGGEDND